MLVRALFFPHASKCGGEAVDGVPAIRLLAEDILELSRSLSPRVAVKEDLPQAPHGVNICRLQLEGGAKVGFRAVEIPLLEGNKSQSVISSCLVPVQLKGRLELC